MDDLEDHTGGLVHVNELEEFDFAEQQQVAQQQLPTEVAKIENRLAYELKDNTQYYSLAGMFVVIYAHITQGRPMTSIFLPQADCDPEFDF